MKKFVCFLMVGFAFAALQLSTVSAQTGMPGGTGGMPPMGDANGMPPMGDPCMNIPNGPDKDACYEGMKGEHHDGPQGEHHDGPPMGNQGMPPMSNTSGMPPMGMNSGMPGMHGGPNGAGPGGPGGMPVMPPGMPGGPGGPGGFVPPPMPPEVERCSKMPPGPDQSRCFDELPCDLGGPPPGMGLEEHLRRVGECESMKMERKGGMPGGMPGGQDGNPRPQLDNRQYYCI